MNVEVIIRKLAGQSIPKSYLETALKKCPTYLGVTVQDDGLLETSAEPKTTSIDELMKMLDELKDVPVVLQLGNMQQDFDKSTDMMPYVFQMAADKDGNPPTDILAVHLEGDFPNYSKPGDGHTDTYNFWEDFLFPTILEKFEASQDVDDFFRRLRETPFKQAVENPISHRGVAVFVPLTGDPIECGRNDLGGEFDWGKTSNTFGWGTQSGLEKTTAAVVETTKKLGRLARALGSTAVTAPPPDDGKKEDPKQDGNGVYHTSSGKAPAADDKVWSLWPGTSSATHTMVKVPAGLQGNARNRWIRTFLSLGPNDDLPKMKDKPDFAIPVPNTLIGFSQEDVSTNDEVKMLASKVVDFRKKGKSADAQSVSSQMKAANEKPAEQPVDSQRPTQDFLPEMSAEDTKIATDLVTDWASNPKAPTALEVQRVESKWPKFSVSRGIKFSDMARWSVADVKMLGKKAPNALALAFVEMRLKVHELGGFAPDVETQPQVANPDTTKKQVEVPSPQPGSAPPKTGRLARAKNANAA